MGTKRSKTPRVRQLTIFPRGGKRRRAGRKPAGERAQVSHAKRPRITEHDPVHVTVRLLPDLPNVREKSTFARVRDALVAASGRFGFRLVEFSVQRDHLHLIAEAEDKASLTRGMQGLLIRVAKLLNKIWQRRGKVFRDRYHEEVLECPTQVRRTLVYVLQNGRKHDEVPFGIDALSSGPFFRGWRDLASSLPSPLAAAGKWLLKTGWKSLGLISTRERPAFRSHTSRGRSKKPVAERRTSSAELVMTAGMS